MLRHFRDAFLLQKAIPRRTAGQRALYTEESVCGLQELLHFGSFRTAVPAGDRSLLTAAYGAFFERPML